MQVHHVSYLETETKENRYDLQVCPYTSSRQELVNYQ